MSLSNETPITGRIHSIESGGMVDGPGIRFVVFTQGCPLRCLYCHNPDTQTLWEGREISVDEVMKEIVKYRSYMRFTGGGVTVTGGEPLIQHHFTREIIRIIVVLIIGGIAGPSLDQKEFALSI